MILTGSTQIFGLVHDIGKGINFTQRDILPEEGHARDRSLCLRQRVFLMRAGRYRALYGFQAGRKIQAQRLKWVISFVFTINITSRLKPLKWLTI